MDQVTPPQNLTAEEAILGSLLIDPNAVQRVRHNLSPGDFYREKNGWVYEAMLSLHKKKEPVDFVTVCDELGPKLKELGGAAYLTKLINASPSSLHVESYAKDVVRCANNRKILEAGTAIAKLAYEDGDDIQAYSKAMSIIRDIPMSGKVTEASGGQGITQEMLHDLVQAHVERERRKAAGYEPSWPWAPMQRMARWRIGQPAVLIAEGGAGKTAFCSSVATHNAINGGRIFYAATEDEPSVLRKRLMATISGVPFRQIETAEYDENYPMSRPNVMGVKLEVPVKLMGAIQSIEAWRGEVHFLPVTGKTVPEIIYDLARLEAAVGLPDAVVMDWFLDHKQRPSADGMVIGLMADILDLKTYAAEHQTRILVATQTGKAGSGKGRLTSFDAYYTSSWNHYAKLAITLKRERELVNGEPVGPFKPELDVFISKANLDLTGSFKLMMRGETFNIYEGDTKDLGYAYD